MTPSRLLRSALSAILTVSLIPMPLTASVAAATTLTPAPLAGILAFPDSPQSVWAPAGIAVASDGTILVADKGNDRIKSFNASGTLLAQWGAPGSAPGQFSAPEALAIGPSDGRVYVADTGNSRIQVFERDGTFVREIGSYGTGDGQFNRPAGVAVDSAGNVYVSDTLNARVERFTADGTFAEKWGSKGDLPDQFDRPAGIAVDSAGYVYVVDTNKHYVKKFDPVDRAQFITWGWDFSSGTGISRYSNPTAISLAPDGASLVVASLGKVLDSAHPERNGKFRVERCDLFGGVIEETLMDAGSAAGQANIPSAAALLPSGAWVISDTGNNRMQLRTASGQWQTPWAAASSATGMVNSPQAVASSPSGDVYYVADTLNNRVLRYTSEGQYLSALATSGTAGGSVLAPAGLLTLADGSLLVADTGNNRIERFDASGAFVSAFGVGNLSAPHGMTVSGLDVLFVADTGNNRIAKFDVTSGGYLGAVGSAGSGNGQFSGPRDVTLDPWDKLWVADTGNNRIQKLNGNTGVFMMAVGTTGQQPGQMSRPAGVSADASGNVLVADTDNDRIQAFDASGVLLTPPTPFGATGAALGRFHAPVAFARSTGGRTLVAERDGMRVQVLVQDAVAPTSAAAGIPTQRVRSATVSLSATDSVAAVRAIYYRVNGVTRTYSAPIDFSTEGDFSGAYWAVDRAGNVEAEHPFSFTVDRTAPSGDLTVGDGTSWTTTTTVSITSTMTGATEMRVGYDAVDGTWVPYSETTSVLLPDADGKYTVNAEFRDEAGNTYALHRLIALDRIAPSVSGLSSPSHPLGVPSYGSIRLSWDAASDPSGIAGYAVSVDSDPAGEPAHTIVTGTSTFDAGRRSQGAWYAHVSACDNAGNWGPAATVRVDTLVDAQPPVTTRSAVPAGPVNAPIVNLGLQATDDLSGVDSTYYRFGSGTVRHYDATIPVTAEGTSTIAYWSTDRAGNTESEHTVVIVIDRTAPAGSFSAPAASPTTTVAITSDVTGASEMKVGTDGVLGDWQPYAGSSTATLSGADGAHAVSVDYRDLAGNTLSLTRDVVLDRVAPVIADLTSPTHPAGTWMYGAPTVRWSEPTDVSGAAGYSVRVDQLSEGDVARSVTTTATTMVLPAWATGVWYVHVAAVDRAGNWGPTQHLQLLVLADVTPPVTSIAGVPSRPSTTSVTLTLSATDDLSGVAKTYYRVGLGADTEYVSAITVPYEGTTTIAYWSQDNAGNRESEQTTDVVVDRTPPDGDFVPAGGLSAVATTTVGITSYVLEAAEMRVGYGAVMSDWAPYSETTSVVLPDVEGTYDIVAEYRDAAGNVASRTHAVAYDRTAPEITGLVSPSHPLNTPTFASLWATWNEPADVTGIAGYAVSIDHDEFGVPDPVITDFTSSTWFGMFAQGSWWIHVRAVDGAGNWGPTSSIPVEVIADTTPPVTTATGVPLGLSAGDVTISLSATDDIAGLDLIRYQVGGGDVMDYYDPIVISAEGRTQLTYWALDNVGNAETPHTCEVWIDRGGAPSVGGLVSTTHTTSALTPPPLCLQWDAASDPSGIAGYAVSIDDRIDGVPGLHIDTTETSYTILFTGTGNRYVHVRACDGAGNWGPAATIPVSVLQDLDPPRTTVLGADSASNATITVTLDAVDDGSGVASTWYSLNGGEYQQYSGPFEVGAEGVTPLRYYSVDVVGNRENPGSWDVAVDRTGPTVLKRGVGFTGVDGSMRASWDAVDAVSGSGGVFVVSVDADPNGEPSIFDPPVYDSYYDIPSPASGPLYLHVRAMDYVGNWSSTTTFDLWGELDTVAPITSAQGIPGEPTSQTVNVSFSVVETGTVLGTWYVVNGGGQQYYDRLNPPAMTFSDEGTTTLEYWSRDVVDNREAPNVATIVIDRTAPTAADDAPAGWVSGPITVHLSAIDSLSAVHTMAVVDGAQAVRAGQVTLSTDGTHTIEYWAQDAAGNTSAHVTRTVTILADAAVTPPAPPARVAFTLGRPSVSAVKHAHATFVVKGSSGAYPLAYRVRLVLERKKGRKWIVVKRPWTTVGPAGAAGAFAVRLKLTPGTWRVTATYSGDGAQLPARSAASKSFRSR